MTPEMISVTRSTNRLLFGIFLVAAALEAFGGKPKTAIYFVLLTIFWGASLTSHRRAI